jgi:salicylate hydroxylase
VKHADVRKLLYDTAISYGTKIRRRARVVDIDSDEGSVTLESGEVLRAHVIIGADGVDGLAREQLLEEEGKLGPRENSSGLMMFK